MTDKELLKFAAKAVGIELEWDSRGAYEVIPGVTGSEKTWGPLTNDGDALRLAVPLNLTISTGGGGPRDPHKANIRVWRFGVPGVCEPKGFDSLAATRRAIVRAAAEIGKAMP